MVKIYSRCLSFRSGRGMRFSRSRVKTFLRISRTVGGGEGWGCTLTWGVVGTGRVSGGPRRACVGPSPSKNIVVRGRGFKTRKTYQTLKRWYGPFYCVYVRRRGKNSISPRPSSLTWHVNFRVLEVLLSSSFQFPVPPTDGGPGSRVINEGSGTPECGLRVFVVNGTVCFSGRSQK